VVSAALEVPYRPVQSIGCSKICLPFRSILIASSIHLHKYRCVEDHLEMLWKSLRVLCKAPRGFGSIRFDLEALDRSSGVSVRDLGGIRTNLNFADIIDQQFLQLIY
jgi:hypothetical protein